MLVFDGITVDDFLQTYGHMPLPPYIAGSAMENKISGGLCYMIDL
jgi:S-adenosylmethionine:tRNA-ribosyltransferase-isomerase (queuine synthetase)